MICFSFVLYSAHIRTEQPWFGTLLPLWHFRSPINKDIYLFLNILATLSRLRRLVLHNYWFSHPNYFRDLYDIIISKTADFNKYNTLYLFKFFFMIQLKMVMMILRLVWIKVHFWGSITLINATSNSFSDIPPMYTYQLRF